MNTQIETLLENIKQDYFNWTSRNGTKELSEHNYTMIEQFNDGLTVNVGSKYIKVVSGSSVWGFVVNTENDKRFKNPAASKWYPTDFRQCARSCFNRGPKAPRRLRSSCGQ